MMCGLHVFNNVRIFLSFHLVKKLTQKRVTEFECSKTYLAAFDKIKNILTEN